MLGRVVIGMFLLSGGQLPQSLVEVEQLIELSEMRRDASLLQKAEGLLGGMGVSKPVGPAAQALGARLLFAQSEVRRAMGDSRAADELLDRAIADTEAAVRSRPKVALPYTVLADLLGRKISFGGFLSGIRYSGRINDALDRARALGPNDIDVHLVIGRNQFHTPAEYGGSLEKAIESFRRAIALDQNRAVAFFWLARSLERAGNREEALVHYGKALELEAGYLDARARRDKLLKR